MHPAFSVIFFTTLSGLGYGIWIWAAGGLLAPRSLPSLLPLSWLLTLAVLPVAIGLLSSTLHLGKPLRAWRAFSQWRTSWLSREGVLAIASFLPWLGLMAMLWGGRGDFAAWSPWLGGALVLLSLATVACTAMIYASLTPIPAWHHRAVLPGYLLFALLTGGLATVAVQSAFAPLQELSALVLLVLAVVLAVLKRRYWRDIDRGPSPVTRASALGLPSDRTATVFERPHTEANYLTTEMGYVLARKHSRRLRRLALLLFAGVPAAACIVCLVLPPLAAPLLALAAVAALLGAMVERWLFFAEARHLVMLYY
ncbi:dimethyl sulfoxide reductase anchor subunit family protein [Arenimonas sp. MALMAid1274]|uniref:dimethyl sulfoxide reductase anchor subunit family protein n=1 Tax=Arenimonas sp. MALMAid1274 TaxID=3411630 RepID=UPI003BA11913